MTGNLIVYLNRVEAARAYSEIRRSINVKINAIGDPQPIYLHGGSTTHYAC